MKGIIEKLRENGIQMCIEPDPDSSIVTITFVKYVGMEECVSSSCSVYMSIFEDYGEAIEWFINIQLDNFIMNLDKVVGKES